MLKSMYRTGLFISLFTLTMYAGVEFTAHLSPINSMSKNLTLEITVDPTDYLYIDYLDISIDHPLITVQPWQTQTPLINHFDPDFQESKKAFAQKALLTMELTAPNFNEIDEANLCVSYYGASHKKSIIQIIPLIFKETSNTLTVQTNIDIPESIDDIQTDQVAKPISCTSQSNNSSWLGWVSKTIEQTHSLPVRLLLVFLLGLLMSLTPCIYPMIPITAGILQTQSSRSIITSFLLALSYTFGIATTFAVLGLLAAFAGQAMGQLMSQPLFILPLVGLLVYLALAMIGVYDMYIPRFFQARNQQVNGGSFISAFTFGALSGIIASPCLSPGLVFLLCLVTTLHSKFLGFILLFIFGIGLSVPLLIIGTFSSSLSLLPRAGMWMVEIKKLFGYLMLGMCLYFLNYITPWHIMIWLIIAFVISLGVIFFYTASHAHNRLWNIIYNCLGVALIASSVLLSVRAFQTVGTQKVHRAEKWNTDYEAARAHASAKNQKLFVDIGAPFCSICKAIDNTLFSDPTVIEFLERNTVLVKIDGSDAAHKSLLQQFHVLGFPTILLLNPETQEVIKQWGPELYGIKSADFIHEVEKLVVT